ncbi:AfsR/SARP family transcriptional regulator [Actinokineospora spheciospongiae]|uniref:AfsR/SARP family transcriptional regulator n=1 Tax=Actinokineospora spheciospongiae TaxID=909613 RepID=UPI0004B97913|nr:BTAD domain-containing putative transcriptional regulator [Actinokineospora spheciospongiae]
MLDDRTRRRCPIDTATGTEPATAFRILGPVEVHGPRGTVRIPPGRQQVILASLLVEANQVVSTEHLVDTLWDDQPPDTARTQVQICVSRLRKSLTDAGVDVPIETRPPGYALRVDPARLDVHSFTRTVAEARVLAKEGRAAEAAGLLRAAVALWRGPCLSGIPHRALRTRALRLDEDRLAATETYLELELGLGRHHHLVGEIARLVQENPLRERLRAQLMLALHRSGRQAEALDVYRAARDLLIDELGLEPGEELRLLETAILAGDPTLHQHATTPERDPGPTAAPAGQRTEVPRQLPADTADFLGDEALIATAEAVLTGEGRAVGVVVIVGRPGVGKSTLATHIGHRVAQEHFPDGQLHCDLRGTRDDPSAAADILGRFLVALGIPGPMIPQGLAERREVYRTLLAGRRVLVVLDDAVAESQVIPLLPGSSTCAVLVTTRTRLTGVPGARQIELDSLDPARSLELLSRVVGTDRVTREPEAAAALVRTVGGLPLALRIIAARLAARPHWSLASMVTRLANERHRLDELAHGEMTIRASLSLTHDGLDPAARRLFGLLSAVEGPTLPGWVAGAVLDDDRPFPSDLLEPLVDVQMLDVASVETTGEFRYRFQDIVRLFAREQVTTPTADAVERVIGGWLAIAEQAHRRIYGGDYTVLHGTAPRWHPPEDYVSAVLADPLEWMDGEQANLRAAITQARTAGLDEACWDLAVTVATLFEARGYLDDWENTHEDALALCRRTGNTRGTAALLSSLGTLHINRGQPAQARTALTAALDLFTTLDEPVGLGLCHRDLALLHRQAGDDDQALTLYTKALHDFDRAGDVVGRAIVRTQSAHILTRRGHMTEAHTHLEEAMAIYRQVGYTSGMAHTLRRLGQVQSQAGDHTSATETMTRVLDMVRSSRDVIGEGHLLTNLGEVCAAAGDVPRAQAYYEEALRVRDQILDHSGAAVIRFELARLLARTGDHTRAVDLLDAAAATFAERGMVRDRAAAERELALLRASNPVTTV